MIEFLTLAAESAAEAASAAAVAADVAAEAANAAAVAADAAVEAANAAGSTTFILQKALVYAGGFAAMAIAGIGSAWGAGCVSASAVGAWKKCYARNKPAPFQLLIFAGAPLSQTIYGMIIMFFSISAANAMTAVSVASWPVYMLTGILAGVAMGISAAWQGIVAAAAADAFAETNKGFTNQLMVLGVIETIAIFVMAFALVLLSSFQA